MSQGRVFLFLMMILAVSGCGRAPRVAGPPAPGTPSGTGSAEGAPAAEAGVAGRPDLDANALFEEGDASWYGDPYHGRQAASGEVFDKNKLTAAHRTLAFDTWVRVENQSNGRSVDVRINDRGPFVTGRIIDLSEAAAREIDMIRSGVAPVRISVIQSPADLPDRVSGDGFYVVQLGAFSNGDNAENLKQQLERTYTGIYVEPPAANGSFYRVLIGRARLSDARSVQEQLRTRDGIDAIIVQVAD